MSHRLCHAGMAATAAHGASIAVLTGSLASEDQVWQGWSWRAGGWTACKARVLRNPVAWMALIPTHALIHVASVLSNTLIVDRGAALGPGGGGENVRLQAQCQALQGWREAKLG